jgi:predicted nucleic acid-binding protein
MKAVDTPVLLDLLRGRLSAAELESLADGEELATTELNIFELEVLARSGGRKGRDHRLAALEGLRRKLTVLPIAAAAVQLAAQHLTEARPRDASSMQWLMLATAEVAGCGEWITKKTVQVPIPGKGLRLVHIA